MIFIKTDYGFLHEFGHQMTCFRLYLICSVKLSMLEGPTGPGGKGLSMKSSGIYFVWVIPDKVSDEKAASNNTFEHDGLHMPQLDAFETRPELVPGTGAGTHTFKRRKRILASHHSKGWRNGLEQSAVF